MSKNTTTAIEDIAERCDCAAGWRPRPGHTAAEVIAAIRARAQASPGYAAFNERVARKQAEMAKGGES